jgi:cation-transporting ATPase 13A1
MVLWMLDEYWKYTAFTLVMILAFEGSTAMTRLRNLKTIRGMGNKPSTLLVYRSKSWQQVTSDQLLPGDLISLRHVQGESNVVPCDCLILSGNAVVNESTLTGESIPQMKVPAGLTCVMLYRTSCQDKIF